MNTTNKIKEAMDKIKVLMQNGIYLYNSSDSALDDFNSDEELFFNKINIAWDKYENNEMYPKEVNFEDMGLSDFITEGKKGGLLTEKEVFNQHLMNMEMVLDELQANKNVLKYDELKEIYDLLVNYWTKL